MRHCGSAGPVYRGAVAEQRFTGAFREAIWRAFDQRCLYCQLPLSFADMEIDHLLPESTTVDGLADYRARLGLPSTFSLVGFEKLAPSCAKCNGEKRALPLADGALMIKLAQIADRRPRLLAELEKKRVGRELDAVLRMVQHSLEAEKFSMDQLSQGLEILRRNPDGMHGASGRDRTPPSPEIPFLGTHFLDRGRVTLTTQATESLSRLDLSERDLLNVIRAFGSTGMIKASRVAGKDGVYELRLSNGMRLYFSVPSEDETVILGLYQRQDPGANGGAFTFPFR
jgi:hypothetical protein